MLNIIQKRKLYLTISGILVALSVIGFFTYGLNYGIDFTGGSLMEMEFKTERPDNNVIKDALSGFSLDSLTVQPVGEKGVILRCKDIDDAKHMAVLQKLDSLASGASSASSTVETLGNVQEKRFDSIGPSIGKELKTKTLWAVILAIIFIALYVAWAFRKVSKRISSWKYGVCAVIALFHDVMIVVGVFVLLGKFYGMGVDVSFIAALLTILGYSVNDTIVIFDRIRENLPKRTESFEEIVNISINEALTRSIHASGTTFVSLIPVYLFGGEAIKCFSLALLIGLILGTYSSIFIASPILVEWQLRGKKSNS
ncbi:MAG: protein translocase subunit SecF [bacterium]